jgi:hypothetical protein
MVSVPVKGGRKRQSFHRTALPRAPGRFNVYVALSVPRFEPPTIEGPVSHALPSLPRHLPIRPRRTREGDFLSSSVQSLTSTEVIITHASNTSEACETHAQPVEKSLASPALSALLTFTLNGCHQRRVRETTPIHPPSLAPFLSTVSACQSNM